MSLELAAGLVVDPHTLTVKTEDGRSVELTPTEWRVLLRLLWARGRVLRKDELAAELFGLRRERMGEVEVYVSRLRAKLGGSRGSVIETVRGRGYRVRTD